MTIRFQDMVQKSPRAGRIVWDGYPLCVPIQTFVWLEWGPSDAETENTDDCTAAQSPHVTTSIRPELTS